MKFSIIICTIFVVNHVSSAQQMMDPSFEAGLKLSEDIVSFLSRMSANRESAPENQQVYEEEQAEKVIEPTVATNVDSSELRASPATSRLEDVLAAAVRVLEENANTFNNFTSTNFTQFLDRIRFVQEMVRSTDDIAQKYQGPIDDIRQAIMKVMMTEIMANFPEIIRQTGEFFSKARESLASAYRQYILEVGEGNQTPQLALLMRLLGIKTETKPTPATTFSQSTEIPLVSSSTPFSIASFEESYKSVAKGRQEVASQTANIGLSPPVIQRMSTGLSDSKTLQSPANAAKSIIKTRSGKI
ncbi:uncharacterized protein LOC141854383 [Brevipalpus obovatus]|uniref:uncharacterized protein LOC141854383 n=1 Tax=Brevipalpus obovatus TaxID=246614 RepID=UPI003D9F66C1